MRESTARAAALVAAACGVVAIVTRPFLFAPLGLIFLLFAARQSADRRVTGAALAVLAVGALAGTAVAVGYTKPLY